LQVYPLEAKVTQLEKYLKHYLNVTLEAVGMRFEPWGSHVYLMVYIYDDAHGKMFSDNNNIGSFVEKEVSVCVPVKWYKNDKFVNWGIVCPFLFGHTGRAVISDREINGRPMVKAKIKSLKDVWLKPSGPSAQRRLLKLETEIYPGLYMAQRAEDRTLIEIFEGLKQDGGSKGNTNSPGKNYKPVASEILGKPQTINWVHLKQHRDAHNTEDLCYQALVKTCRNIRKIHKFNTIKKDINIRLHKYPGRPIAKLLGLVPNKDVESCGDSVVEIFRAVDPFWMRISMEEPLGEVVCYRLNDQPWVVFEEALPFL
jgi:hypothetical protein